MTRSFDALHIDLSASGASPLWSWVSDDRRELCPRFDLALGEFSCCQFLVGEMLSDYRNYERIQPLQGVTASRRRWSMNHADFWVTPISLPSCKLEMPLRAVTSRYMA